MIRVAIGVLAGLVCTDCATSQKIMIGRPVQQQVAILVSTSQEVNDADETGGVATLAETVSNGLKEHGMVSQIYASKYDHPAAPRIELNVLFWDEPGANSRKFAAAAYIVPGLGVAAFVTGFNRIIVDCTVYMPGQAQPAFHRRYDKTHPPLLLTETDGLASAASAGAAIVSDITRD